MFDLEVTLADIRQWPNMTGVAMPEGLQTALDTLDALNRAEGVALDYPHPDDLTPDNVAGHLETLTTAQAVKSFQPGSISAEQQVRTTLRDRLARRVIREADEAVPAIADQLRPEVDKAAESFCEAVGQLPDPLTAESLVKAGTDAMSAYERAKRAAAMLHTVDQWLASVASGVPSQTYAIPKPNKHVGPVLRLASPPTRGGIQALLSARDKVDDTVRELGPVFYAAAVNGIPMGLNLPTEAAQKFERIENGYQAEREAERSKSAEQLREMREAVANHGKGKKGGSK